MIGRRLAVGLTDTALAAGCLVAWGFSLRALAAIVFVAVLGVAGVVWQLRETQQAYAETQQAYASEARTNYFNRIGLAAQAWADSNFWRSAELLAKCTSDQRGWE